MVCYIGFGIITQKVQAVNGVAIDTIAPKEKSGQLSTEGTEMKSMVSDLTKKVDPIQKELEE